MTPDEIWKSTLDILQRQMTRATYDTLFGQSGLTAANGEYVVQVRSDMTREWLENRLSGVVARSLETATGQAVTPDQLRFVTNGSAGRSKQTRQIPVRLRERRKGNRYLIDREFVFGGYAAILGAFAAAVYNVLCAHVANDGQDCHLYYSTMALEAGISRRQAMREIKRLETNRLIEVERHNDGVRANEISLLDISEWRL